MESQSEELTTNFVDTTIVIPKPQVELSLTSSNCPKSDPDCLGLYEHEFCAPEYYPPGGLHERYYSSSSSARLCMANGSDEEKLSENSDSDVSDPTPRFSRPVSSNIDVGYALPEHKVYSGDDSVIKSDDVSIFGRIKKSISGVLPKSNSKSLANSFSPSQAAVAVGATAALAFVTAPVVKHLNKQVENDTYEENFRPAYMLSVNPSESKYSKNLLPTNLMLMNSNNNPIELCPHGEKPGECAICRIVSSMELHYINPVNGLDVLTNMNDREIYKGILEENPKLQNKPMAQFFWQFQRNMIETHRILKLQAEDKIKQKTEGNFFTRGYKQLKVKFSSISGKDIWLYFMFCMSLIASLTLLAKALIYYRNKKNQKDRKLDPVAEAKENKEVKDLVTYVAEYSNVFLLTYFPLLIATIGLENASMKIRATLSMLSLMKDWIGIFPSDWFKGDARWTEWVINSLKKYSSEPLRDVKVEAVKLNAMTQKCPVKDADQLGEESKDENPMLKTVKQQETVDHTVINNDWKFILFSIILVVALSGSAYLLYELYFPKKNKGITFNDYTISGWKDPDDGKNIIKRALLFKLKDRHDKYIEFFSKEDVMGFIKVQARFDSINYLDELFSAVTDEFKIDLSIALNKLGEKDYFLVKFDKEENLLTKIQLYHLISVLGLLQREKRDYKFWSKSLAKRLIPLAKAESSEYEYDVKTSSGRIYDERKPEEQVKKSKQKSPSDHVAQVKKTSYRSKNSVNEIHYINNRNAWSNKMDYLFGSGHSGGEIFHEFYDNNLAVLNEWLGGYKTGDEIKNNRFLATGFRAFLVTNPDKFEDIIQERMKANGYDGHEVTAYMDKLAGFEAKTEDFFTIDLTKNKSKVNYGKIVGESNSNEEFTLNINKLNKVMKKVYNNGLPESKQVCGCLEKDCKKYHPFKKQNPVAKTVQKQKRESKKKVSEIKPIKAESLEIKPIPAPVEPSVFRSKKMEPCRNCGAATSFLTWRQTPARDDKPSRWIVYCTMCNNKNQQIKRVSQDYRPKTPEGPVPSSLGFASFVVTENKNPDLKAIQDMLNKSKNETFSSEQKALQEAAMHDSPPMEPIDFKRSRIAIIDADTGNRVMYASVISMFAVFPGHIFRTSKNLEFHADDGHITKIDPMRLKYCLVNDPANVDSLMVYYPLVSRILLEGNMMVLGSTIYKPLQVSRKQRGKSVMPTTEGKVTFSDFVKKGDVFTHYHTTKAGECGLPICDEEGKIVGVHSGTYGAFSGNFGLCLDPIDTSKLKNLSDLKSNDGLKNLF